MTARPLMIQGTMSGVGKSLLVAGLCRVLAQDGVRVAPFKSQNMALNSCITKDGLEMGRAQVVQAECARIEPDAAMNPILLKPTSDTGSQVIVGGKPIGTMSARDYFAYKARLVPRIMEAYASLAAEYDVILIEGAGSPAEVNLKADDIVNMGMAKRAASPVLLAGDIDRGGVFAQLIGTMMLLDPDERALVKGSIVNKFRGDVGILKPGLDILRERMGVPVVGVVPYAPLDIDDEDSLSPRLAAKRAGALLDIAVVRLPKISNFTDFVALSAAEGAGVRYVGSAHELAEPDLIILPGTKSTLADLRWLRETGLEAAILRRAAAGTPVFGICGGYQMLGQGIADPAGAEAEGGGSMRGLGLLPISTVFAPEKHQVRSVGSVACVQGVLSGMSGAAVEGYQIHMGETTRLGGEPFCELSQAHGAGPGGEAPVPDGCQQGNVYGTYLHGIFDSPACAQGLLDSLLAAKGLSNVSVQAPDMRAYKEAQYDELARVLRESLDMDLVYRIIEEGA